MKKIINLFQRTKVNNSGCLIWLGAKTAGGYSSIRWNGRTDYGHRIVYRSVKGEIPEGATLDHMCRNRACINPDHLEPVSRGENVLRGISGPAKNAKKTHCPKGHPYDEANTCHSGGHRYCRQCAREKMQAKRREV